MHRICVLSCMVVVSWNALASDHLTEARLAARVASVHRRSDKQAAHDIARIHLQERLATSRLMELQAILPGDESRRQLLAIADMSAFLPPAMQDVVEDEAPGVQEQKQMLTAAFKAARRLLPGAPDLQYKRITTLWHGMKDVATPGAPAVRMVVEDPVFVSTEETEMVFGGPLTDLTVRSGSPVERLPLRRAAEPGGGAISLVQSVMSDVETTMPVWTYWERRGQGKSAVFSYKVPSSSSHLAVPVCCGPEPAGDGGPPYEGELAFDPATGDLDRLTISAGGGKQKTQVVVEFGRQVLGGKMLNLPCRRVEITLSRVFLGVRNTGSTTNTNWSSPELEFGNVKALLDEEFSGYEALSQHPAP